MGAWCACTSLWRDCDRVCWVQGEVKCRVSVTLLGGSWECTAWERGSLSLGRAKHPESVKAYVNVEGGLWPHRNGHRGHNLGDLYAPGGLPEVSWRWYLHPCFIPTCSKSTSVYAGIPVSTFHLPWLS